MIDFRRRVQDEKEAIITVRRELHRIPEMAFCERQTSALVANHLRRMGFGVEMQRKIGA